MISMPSTVALSVTVVSLMTIWPDEFAVVVKSRKVALKAAPVRIPSIHRIPIHARVANVPQIEVGRIEQAAFQQIPEEITALVGFRRRSDDRVVMVRNFSRFDLEADIAKEVRLK